MNIAVTRESILRQMSKAAAALTPPTPPHYRLRCRQAAAADAVAANVYRCWGRRSTPAGVKEGDDEGGKGNGDGDGDAGYRRNNGQFKAGKKSVR